MHFGCDVVVSSYVVMWFFVPLRLDSMRASEIGLTILSDAISILFYIRSRWQEVFNVLQETGNMSTN